ncbi:type II secretion system protein [Bacillus aquiflavi]|uniref:Type II secretion system protein n=1 Tax=Bacillus aquiflavi TaxID=2672567 RepID=A0A6B3VYW5_9BACI|nr:type II secretion system protein [Bacillus aquiflavi]MBA4537207.1 type II secretion system protein [Bacillus aquiflavi]NEY81465.1 type II secretion system protein [Bacillus aquiflavi]
MLKFVKKHLKKQHGLTLFELLAIVMILGIIAAIAVPSVGEMIDNKKKDVHVRNAQQMINSAKKAVEKDKRFTPKDVPTYVSLKYLEDERYVEKILDPDGGDTKLNRGYKIGSYTKDRNESYVKITRIGPNLEYSVKLVNHTRGVMDQNQGPISEQDLDREKIIELESWSEK